MLALCHTKNPVIVELGAHVGEEWEWLRDLRPSYYGMVEPEPKNLEILERKCSGVAIYPCAIGPPYHARFYSSENYQANNRASGSIRKPTGHLQHFPEVKFTPAEVFCASVDSLFFFLDHIDLLWCDIQGAERDMIEGGRTTLANTRFMMIEAEPEVELYEGQALKPELIAMLPDWEIIKDFGYNLFMRNTKYAQPV